MLRLPAFFLVILLFFTSGLHGQESQTLQLPKQGDVRIIVDISGSMKANDPNNLRQPAVRLLARMIPDGAEAGVWTFGQWVNMLVPHGEVGEDWRSTAVEKSREINSVALRTNLGEAIEKASDAYLSGEDLSATDFILLTDGKVDLSDDESVNQAERERILGPLLTRLTSRGATLHTVALSEEADLEMLEALAAQSGGHFSLTESAEGLNRAFLKALNAAVPQDQIPLSDEGFTVDSGVEEFTALIFWGEEETSATRSLELVGPNGQAFSKDRVADNMRWAAETGYDLITVTAPAAGKWVVNGELGDGSRVTVVSDLRMVVSPVPPTFTADEPVALKIAFFEEDSRIENPDFLNVIDVIVRLTSSDGRSGSKVLGGNQPPPDGIYTDEIASLPAAGDYELEVIADGNTFSRRFTAVTRFIAPATADPAAGQEVSPAMPAEPEQSPEEPAQQPPVEPFEPSDSEPAGPIDLSEVETPATPLEKSATDQAAEEAMPIWVWAAAGGAGLLIAGAGIWFLIARRKQSGEQEIKDQDPPAKQAEAQETGEPESEPEAEQEPDPEPEEATEEDIPELESSSDESEEQESGPEEDSDDIPELEPEAEPEPDPEPETEPKQEEETESAPNQDDDDDEFGLEDFDLSEFDDLPEDTGDEDDKKKKDE